MRRVLAVVVAASLALGACGVLPGAAPDLEGSGWRAMLVAGHQPIAGREPFLRFSDGKVTGSGGCNQIGGRATIDGGRIAFTELSGTAMGCDARINDIEGLFMTALLQAEALRLDGGNLVIAGTGGEIVLRPDPTLP